MAISALTSCKNPISALWCWVEELWQEMVNSVCDLRLETADLRKELKRMQTEIDRLRAQVQHNEDKDRKRQFCVQQQALLELCHSVSKPRLRSDAEEASSLHEVARHALAVAVAAGEVALRAGESLRGAQSVEARALGVVPTSRRMS